MCVGIPMRVVEPRGGEALAEGRGQRQLLDMLLIGPQPAGTWVLAYLGTAREVLSAERAGEVDAALDGLEAVLSGETENLDRFFPGLAGRVPELPDFLKEKQ